MSEAPTFLYSECPACGDKNGLDDEQLIPCPHCGCPEVENVWADGQRTEAFADAAWAEGCLP